jgi:hypothetical protein
MYLLLITETVCNFKSAGLHESSTFRSTLNIHTWYMSIKDK